MEKVIIVRYGEIGIKSYWVRREFEKKLMDNLSRALLENKIEIEKIRQRGARIYVWCKQMKKVLKVIKNVFGVVSYSPAQIIKTDLEEMKKTALKIYKKSKKKKFRITTRRRFKKFPLTSMQISSEVGAYIVEKTGAKVDLEKYDINISFEVDKKETYVFYEFYKGWGGLPIGTQGKVLCFTTNDVESWINVWLMARRGCEIVIADAGKNKKRAKNFDKKYYYTEDVLTYYNISNAKDKIGRAVDIAKLENAKAIVVPQKYVGKFEARTDLPVFYPSLGFMPSMLRKLWKEVGLD
ncbi:MAG: hypothetical protein J7K73_03560 [Nanoarchaeota archaeon]|nr:hypothetical protein [Nanoarchaeota archaeon]